MVGRAQPSVLLKSSGTVTTNLTLACANCLAMSACVLRGLDGATTAPRRTTARYTIGNSGRFGESNNTTSFGLTPQDVSPAAVFFTILYTCIYNTHTSTLINFVLLPSIFFHSSMTKDYYKCIQGTENISSIHKGPKVHHPCPNV